GSRGDDERRPPQRRALLLDPGDRGRRDRLASGRRRRRAAQERSQRRRSRRHRRAGPPPPRHPGRRRASGRRLPPPPHRAAARMTRVLNAEDQAMVRGALASLLALEYDIEVVAEVERGDHVLEAAAATAPDVALLDIEMPGLDGISVAQALAHQQPETRSLILTTFGR